MCPLHADGLDPKSIVFDLESFKDKRYLTHNFHPYPAKFVPQIPRLVLEALSARGERVLDPFCGSGTTLVEAARLGRIGFGIDLNPLACLVARVKTTPLSAEEIQQVHRVARRIHDQMLAGQLDPRALRSVDIPEFRNRQHWFRPHVARELAAIRQLIWSIEEGRVRDFLEVAFSAIVVKVSNQDSDTRWVAVPKDLPPGCAHRAILAKISDMIGRLESFVREKPIQPTIICQSATDRFPLSEDTVDLVVTSPPYLNSYDYYLYHKLRLFWLGIDHYPIQAKEIGSRNRHSDLGQGIDTYVEPMKASLGEILRVLKPAGYLCVVIGDAVLRGCLVDMGELFVGIATQQGFGAVRHEYYDQRKFTTSFTKGFQRRKKRTHILFFQKPTL